MKGGGFLVSGIGDVNRDGFNDVMITSYYDWAGKGDAYLVPYPSFIRTNLSLENDDDNSASFPSSSPSGAPSSFREPSSQPSSLPPTSEPTTKNSGYSSRPSMRKTSLPSRNPTIRPSRIPTKNPTKTPSRPPSIRPTQTQKPSTIPIRTPTKRPTAMPSYCLSARPSPSPSFRPTISSSQPLTVVNITEVGTYTIPDGNTEVRISLLKISSEENTNNVITVRGQHTGRRIYTIIPIVNMTTIIKINDFNQDMDIINLYYFHDYTSIKDLSYSTQPLTLLLTTIQRVTITNMMIMNLTSDNFRFHDGITSPSSSLSSSSSSSSSISGLIQMITNDSTDFTIIVLSLGIILMTVVYGYYPRKRDSKKSLLSLSSRFPSRPLLPFHNTTNPLENTTVTLLALVPSSADTMSKNPTRRSTLLNDRSSFMKPSSLLFPSLLDQVLERSSSSILSSSSYSSVFSILSFKEKGPYLDSSTNIGESDANDDDDFHWTSYFNPNEEEVLSESSHSMMEFNILDNNSSNSTSNSNSSSNSYSYKSSNYEFCN